MSVSPLAAPDAAPPAPSRRAWALLAALTVLVAALHLVGLDFHLPHHPQADEKPLWLQVQIARGVEVSPEERLLARCYPSLLGRVADAVIPAQATPVPGDVDSLRASVAHTGLWIRRIVAVLSALIVPATWLAARRLVRPETAWLATLLVATSTIAVWYSSMGRPHAVVAVFTTATVAASLRARASGLVRDFALAGVFAALAVGTLHSGACACAAVAAAWWWNARPRWGAPLGGAVIAAALVIASLLFFLRGEPLPDLRTETAAGDVLLSFFGMGVHNVDSGFFDGGGFARFARALRDYEPVLATLAIGGLAVAVARAWRARGPLGRGARAVAWTAAAHPLAHLALFGAYGDSFQRFWFPVLPALALLAAIGIDAAWRAPRPAARAVLRAAVAVLLAGQLAVVAKLAVLRVRDDTHELAAQWIVAHPEAAPFHVGPTVMLPLVPRDPQYRAELVPLRMFFIPWTAKLVREGEPWRAQGYDLHDPPMRREQDRDRLYGDLARWIYDRGLGVMFVERFYDGRRRPLQLLRAELLRRAPPIATFDPQPCDVPGTRPIEYLLDGPAAPEAWFAWSALWAARLGPELEVYTLTGE